MACAFSAAVEDFEVWEPVPFRGKQAWHPTVSQKISMETPVKFVEVEHSTLLAGCLVGVWITKRSVIRCFSPIYRETEKMLNSSTFKGA